MQIATGYSHPDTTCVRTSSLQLNPTNEKTPTISRGIFIGGLTYTSMKHHLDDKFREDLISLHAKLVDLGMEYRDGKVYLADLDEKDV